MDQIALLLIVILTIELYKSFVRVRLGKIRATRLRDVVYSTIASNLRRKSKLFYQNKTFQLLKTLNPAPFCAL